jgi:hypothetical protein
MKFGLKNNLKNIKQRRLQDYITGAMSHVKFRARK